MKRYVTYEEVSTFVNYVCDKLKDKNICGVYGIPKGGLPLAVMIANKLSVPLLMGAYDGCLIVDDICDTGESLLHYQNDSSGTKSKKYIIATMFFKDNDLVKPDYYSYEKENDWIVFPWEI